MLSKVNMELTLSVARQYSISAEHHRVAKRLIAVQNVV